MVMTIRVTLAAVFAVAAITKLADNRGSRLAVAGVGLPAWTTAPLAVLLPVAEAAVAVALMAIPGRGSALAALGLVAALNAGLALRVLRGETGDCNCFGGANSTPVGWRTLARNMVLAAAVVALYAAAGH